MPDIIHRITQGISQALAERGLEEFAFKWLEGKAPDDVYLAIKGNRTLISGVDPQTLGRLRNVVLKSPEWSSQVITEEYMLPLIRKKRPEIFATIINTPGGLEWGRKQIREIRQLLGI